METFGLIGTGGKTEGGEAGASCPLCGHVGERVGSVTVAYLVKKEFRESVVTDPPDEGYRICMDPRCDAVYYGQERIFLQAQVGVPVWFKEGEQPKLACYCSRVTEDDVIDAVVNHGARSVRDVNALTGAMRNPDCEKNNPRGECCHESIRAAIRKGMDLLG